MRSHIREINTADKRERDRETIERQRGTETETDSDRDRDRETEIDRDRGRERISMQATGASSHLRPFRLCGLEPLAACEINKADLSESMCLGRALVIEATRQQDLLITLHVHSYSVT